MSTLSLRGVTVRYGPRAMTAVAGVDLDVPDGTVVGLVGESGSGKSTLAKAAVGLVPVAVGRIELDGQDIVGNARAPRRRRRRVQLVFQDPHSSLDPRMTVGESLREALTATRRRPRAELLQEIPGLLELVSLEADLQDALPRHLSGGQLQRIAIARALAAEPSVLIADEITSSLDVSVQGSVLNTVRDVQARLGLTILFISHNLAVVRYVADVIAVMYLGQIVELAPTEPLLAEPQHPYTKVLLDAAPGAGSTLAGQPRSPLEAEPPDPHDPPSGCRFHPRCPLGPEVLAERAVCRGEDPTARAASRRHGAACHFVEPAGPT